MNAPLLATRAALAKVLHDGGTCCTNRAHEVFEFNCERTADALLASGILRDPSTLADDLCKRLCDMAGEPRLFIPGEIRAILAAALSDDPS